MSPLTCCLRGSERGEGKSRFGSRVSTWASAKGGGAEAEAEAEALWTRTTSCLFLCSFCSATMSTKPAVHQLAREGQTLHLYSSFARRVSSQRGLSPSRTGQSNLLRIQVEENPDLLLTVDTVRSRSVSYSSHIPALTQLFPLSGLSHPPPERCRSSSTSTEHSIHHSRLPPSTRTGTEDQDARESR
jgi:hypothetical protein